MYYSLKNKYIYWQPFHSRVSNNLSCLNRLLFTNLDSVVRLLIIRSRTNFFFRVGRAWNFNGWCVNVVSGSRKISFVRRP